MHCACDEKWRFGSDELIVLKLSETCLLIYCHRVEVGSYFKQETNMPVLLERSRPTKDQQRAVHAYIRRQREKGKQALAESKAKEEEEKQRKKEEEKKKETVEDVKKEIAELESKLEQLKQKKHELFSQFKRALNYENEMKKQQENQASLKASTCITLTSSSRGVQGLATGQVALTPTVHPQSTLADAAPGSGGMICTSNGLKYLYQNRQ